RKGDELLIKVGAYKRNVLLHQALQPLEISGANLRGGTLVVPLDRRRRSRPPTCPPAPWWCGSTPARAARPEPGAPDAAAPEDAHARGPCRPPRPGRPVPSLPALT